MKTTTRLLTFIGGLFRSVITILFLFATIFAGFVDKKLLSGFLDIVGFSPISLGFVKPIAIIILICGFFLNFKVTRNIFQSRKTGEKFLSNIFFACFFIIIDLLILLFIRERLIYIPLVLNALIILASIMGIYNKSRGAYHSGNSDEEMKKIQDANKEKIKEKKIDINKAPKLRKIEATSKRNTLANSEDEPKLYSLNFASEKKEEAKLDNAKEDSNPSKEEKSTLTINKLEEKSSNENIIEEEKKDE